MLRDGLDRGRVAVEGPDHGRQEGVLAFTTDVPEVVRGDVPHHDAAEAHVRRVLGLRTEAEFPPLPQMVRMRR